MDISDIDLKGKHVIMKTRAALNLDIIDQVYFCDSGFGCDPGALGTKVNVQIPVGVKIITTTS